MLRTCTFQKSIVLNVIHTMTGNKKESSDPTSQLPDNLCKLAYNY